MHGFVFRLRLRRSIVREMQNRASLPLITMADYVCALWMDIARVKQSEILSHLKRGLIYMLLMHGFVFRSRPYGSIVRKIQNRASLHLITTIGREGGKNDSLLSAHCKTLAQRLAGCIARFINTRLISRWSLETICSKRYTLHKSRLSLPFSHA